MKDIPLVRWTALVLFSFVMFSSYYFYDVFSGIKTELQVQVGWTNTEYGTWYGAYSLTNSIILMAFLGGIILDRWGIRRTGFTFLSFMLLGTFLIAYGASETFMEGGAGFGVFDSFLSKYSPALKLMILGRILFGLGAETFYVTLNKIIAKWFKGKELALAFAISLAFGRFGTAAALIFSRNLLTAGSSVTAAGYFGFGLMVVGLFTFITFAIMDNRYDRQIKQRNGQEVIEKLRWIDLKLLFSNRSFIYITLLCLTFYGAVFPFMPFAADLLYNKFGVAQDVAGRIVTILPFGTVIFTPVFGWVCDFKGKSASLMILGSLLLIVVHLILALTHIWPLLPMFLLGVAFSLVPAAMWPAVAKIVAQNRLGTAYGTMFTIQNYGLMLIPILMGFILDRTNPDVNAAMVEAGTASYDYQWTILLLVVLGLLGLFFAVMLKREDRVSGHGLEEPNKKPAA